MLIQDMGIGQDIEIGQDVETGQKAWASVNDSCIEKIRAKHHSLVYEPHLEISVDHDKDPLTMSPETKSHHNCLGSTIEVGVWSFDKPFKAALEGNWKSHGDIVRQIAVMMII